MGRQAADDIVAAMEANWPEAVSPVSKLMIRTYRLSRLIGENASAQAARHGLTLTEFEVLAALRSRPPPHELTPTDLYDGVLISSGGLTKVLTALDRAGLIARSESKSDRRSKPVRLTPRGRTIIGRAMQDVQRSDGALIFGGLSATEVAALTTLLQKLLSTLESPAH